MRLLVPLGVLASPASAGGGGRIGSSTRHSTHEPRSDGLGKPFERRHVSCARHVRTCWHGREIAPLLRYEPYDACMCVYVTGCIKTLEARITDDFGGVPQTSYQEFTKVYVGPSVTVGALHECHHTMVRGRRNLNTDFAWWYYFAFFC
jgi:hypothetical protein